MPIFLTRVLVNMGLAALSALVALTALELGLRVVSPLPQQYFVQVPGSGWTAGVPPEPLIRVHVNSFGLRGPSFGADGAEYRILAIGGSTTECGGMDDAKVWTHLLEAGLPRTADRRRAWVGNVGRVGATTRDHLLQEKYLLPEYPRIDVVLALVGVNDMMSALRQGWEYRQLAPLTEQSAERPELRRAFAVVPARLESPWYKGTALWELARRAKVKWRSDRIFDLHDRRSAGLAPARLRRRSIGATIDSLPSLEQPLLEYRRNLITMADLAAAAGARLVLVTQPSVWRDTMTDAEQRRLWFGWVGGDWSSSHAYFTAGALSRAMATYNQTLLDVCRRKGLDCVDAARVLPRDSTVFVDDVHFTERGSQLLAQTLAAQFRGRAPFAAPPHRRTSSTR